jgi:hypothetical protein
MFKLDRSFEHIFPPIDHADLLRQQSLRLVDRELHFSPQLPLSKLVLVNLLYVAKELFFCKHTLHVVADFTARDRIFLGITQIVIHPVNTVDFRTPTVTTRGFCQPIVIIKSNQKIEATSFGPFGISFIHSVRATFFASASVNFVLTNFSPFTYRTLRTATFVDTNLTSSALYTLLTQSLVFANTFTATRFTPMTNTPVVTENLAPLIALNAFLLFRTS